MSKAASVVEECNGYKVLEGEPPRKPGMRAVGPSWEEMASLELDTWIQADAKVVKLSSIKSRCGVANTYLKKQGKDARVIAWQEGDIIVIRRRK